MRGAVSPAILDTAKSTPVKRPFLAAGSTTFKVVRQLCTPSASDASRRVFGTSFRDSSVVLVISGIMINANAIEPAIAENDPSASTIRPYMVMPIMIEGNCVIMLLIVRRF